MKLRIFCFWTICRPSWNRGDMKLRRARSIRLNLMSPWFDVLRYSRNSLCYVEKNGQFLVLLWFMARYAYILFLWYEFLFCSGPLNSERWPKLLRNAKSPTVRFRSGQKIKVTKIPNSNERYAFLEEIDFMGEN